MARRKKIYEGKAKILYEGPEPGTLIQYFKDEAIAPTSARPQSSEAVADGRGVLNNRLSEFFLTGLNSLGVPTYFIRRLNMREQLIRMVEVIPLFITVRNYAAGDLSARLDIPEGTPLPRPIVEFYFKDDKLGHPLVTEEHIIAFGWAGQQDLDDMVALALRVNDFLSGVMLGVGMRIADFRIEVGRIWEGEFMRLILADEISPDNCRLWDMREASEGPPREGADDAGNAEVPTRTPDDVYTVLAQRLGVLPSVATHPMRPTLIN